MANKTPIDLPLQTVPASVPTTHHSLNFHQAPFLLWAGALTYDCNDF